MFVEEKPNRKKKLLHKKETQRSIILRQESVIMIDFTWFGRCEHRKSR